MKAKYFFLILVFFVLGLVFSRPVLAHNPRLVEGQEAPLEEPIIISSPDISQAFYGRLKGQSEYYQFTLSAPQKFYFQTMVPDIKNIKKDISAELISQANQKLVVRLEAAGANWPAFFEPFSGDHYFQGPDFKITLSPGTYLIKVYNPDNEGKYILVVGQREVFTAKEIFNTLVSLPALKIYFNESPLSAYFNRVGLFSGAFIAFLIILFIFIRWLFRRI